MLVYTIVVLVIIYFLLIAYFKIKYPFWSRQPVFHYHNMYYWFKPPGIINENLPLKDRFFDNTIDFYNYEQMTAEKKEPFVKFIKNNFMPSKFEKYSPSDNAIIDNFESHNDKSFISYKMYNGEILSCMTTKPLECYLDGNKIVVNYVDYLCVHEKHRKKMYAAKQIFTHYYHMRHRGKNIVSLFKRENKTTSIVPLTTYSNYIFKIDNWEYCYSFDQPNINIIFVGKSNLNKFYHIYSEMKEAFECFLSVSMSHILHLIEQEHIKISILMINNVFKGVYIFKNAYTTYDGLGSLEFSSSYKNPSINDELFTLGFLISMSLISKDISSSILLIENISNNNIILKLLLEKYTYLSRTTNSLYFYNFAYHPKESGDVFCIL